MALVNLAPMPAKGVAPLADSPDRGSISHDQGTWLRTMLETVGTFLLLAGIAVGILTLRLALMLIHAVIH